MDSYGLNAQFEQEVANHFCSDKHFFHLFQKFIEPTMLASKQAQLAINTAKSIYKDINDAPGAHCVVLNRAGMQANQGKLEMADYTELNWYLNDSQKSDPKVIAKEFAPILKEHHRHMTLMKAVDKKASRQSFEEISALIDELERIGEYVEGKPPLSLDDDSLFYALQVMSNLNRMATGIDEVDLCLSGGLPLGNLGVIITRPSGGKSMTLSQLASYGLATGKTVAHIVISEIPGEIGGARTLAPIIGQKISDVTADPMGARDAWHAYKRNNVVGGYKVFDFESQSSVAAIRAHVMGFYKKLGVKPDLILFDYLGLATSTKAPKDSNGYNQGKFVTGELLDWARQEALCIWTAAQSTRMKQNGKGSHIIGLDDIADSYHIVRIADVVISFNTREPVAGMFEGQFFIAKHRVGPSGQLTSLAPVNWDTGVVAACSLFAKARPTWQLPNFSHLPN